jgi:endonuclease/exonuclease/phosphatase family metal-dependent hydrolase
MTAYWQEGTDKYNPAKKPIDYVFYTTGDFDAMVYRNIHYHRDGIYMSDHLPQYCELHVKVPAEQAPDAE